MVNMFMMGYGLIWVDYCSGKIQRTSVSNILLCDVMVNMFMMGYSLIWVDCCSGKMKDY